MSETAKTHGGHKFGTFGGVFTPSILTIFGLIMFMRAGYVVGNGGVLWALCILCIAESICIATGLSIAAISTNTPVGGGGAYYLISRALGPGFGSAIGLTLFFAQTLSVPFYILGFSEAMAKDFPLLAPYYLELNLCVGLLLVALVWAGAAWAVKCQFFVLAVLGASIFTFLAGLAIDFRWETAVANAAPRQGAAFFDLFAIFFPAVTGIMAGVNMSGDLKEPAKSLPRGTLAAIMAGFVVYFLQLFLMGGAGARGELMERPYLFLVGHALMGAGFMVVVGVVSATISSALGSLVGAPRILQALGRDKFLSWVSPFEAGAGPHNEPRRALILSGIVTLLVLYWGGRGGVSESGGEGALNVVAEVVSMFFLYTYGMVNLAAFVESFGANPSFRPRFRYYHWSIALYGALSCVAVSLCINWWASLAALAIITALYYSSSRQALKIAFGDARRGFVFSCLRRHLVQLRGMPPDPKNWRPNLLVLISDYARRAELLDYASLFECGRGILSVAQFLPGSLPESQERRAGLMEDLEKFTSSEYPASFAEVIVCEDFDRSLPVFLQGHSIGPLKPNLVMLGWPNDDSRGLALERNVKAILSLGRSCVIMANGSGAVDEPAPGQSIDVWWRGRTNGSLMLILAYLLVRNPEWRKSSLRILRSVPDISSQDGAYMEMEQLAKDARIEADVRVFVSDEPFEDILRRESKEAAAVFLGFNAPLKVGEGLFHRHFSGLLKGLPVCFLVSSSGHSDLMA